MTPKLTTFINLGLAVLGLLLMGGCNARSEVQTKPPTATNSDASATPPRPHVLIVLIDTLRADRLGCYGDPRGLTPTMDAWTAEGVVFENAIAPSPWTLPSCASLFTATYPPVHGANSSQYEPGASRGGKNVVRGIPEELPTLFEDLARGGYVGLGITENHFLKGGRGFNRGFERWVFNDFVKTNRGAHLNATAFEWLKNAKLQQPHVFYLHYMDVHEPYWAEDRFVKPRVTELSYLRDLHPVDNPQRSLFRRSLPPYDQDLQHVRLSRYVEYWRARYDAGVMQADAALADLQKQLEAMGLWEDLFVILTADHGESLGEHGQWSHGDTTYQTELHVPLIMRWPGHMPAGKRVQTNVSLIDILPTVCEALQIEVPHHVQGRSLMALITADAEEQTELSGAPIFASGVQRKPQEFAVIVKDRKLRVDPANGLFEFHVLAEDPEENEFQAMAFAGEVKLLQDLLANHQTECDALANGHVGKAEELSPEDLEALRSLGYLGGDDE